MAQRIRTSSVTAENLTKIQNKYHFSTKAAILRACISVSLREDKDPIYLLDDIENKTGFDISLSTLFGDDEVYYKSMIKFKANKNLEEKEYVDYIIAHIEQGMTIIYGAFATTYTLQSFIEKIV